MAGLAAPQTSTLGVMEGDWPFPQSQNTAVISQRSVVFEGAPILYVTHDKDDDGWQFLDGKSNPAPDSAAVVSFAEIVAHDPSLIELADLPAGWVATRRSITKPWVRVRRAGNDT